MQIQSEEILFCMRFKVLVLIKYNAFKKIVIKFDFILNNLIQLIWENKIALPKYKLETKSYLVSLDWEYADFILVFMISRYAAITV